MKFIIPTISCILYYAALENGMVSSSTFLSEPTSFMFSNENVYSPANYNDKYANKNITLPDSQGDNLSLVGAILALCEAHLRLVSLLLNFVDTNDFVGIGLGKCAHRKEHCKRTNAHLKKILHTHK